MSHPLASPSAGVLVRLVESLAVTVDGRVVPAVGLGSRRGRLLLQLLAAERTRMLGVDEIAGVLWPEDPPASPDAAVATLVSRLRRVLGAEAIVGGRGTYRLGSAPVVQVDLDQAAELVAESERRVDTEPALSASAAARALGLLGQAVLADQPTAEWAEPARVEHAALLHRARLTASRAALLSDDPTAAVGPAAAAVAANPLDEDAVRALMTAHHAVGRPADALAAYEELRHTLADELGIDPAQATQQLHLAVLRDETPQRDGSRSASRRTTLAATTTYSPSTTLAGRNRELATLRQAWASATAGSPETVVVLGESGIGKTRLAEEVAADAKRTGGTVLVTRCFEAERSLLLQPVVDALEPALARMSVATLASLTGDEGPALTALFPIIGKVLGIASPEGGSDAFRLRRLFEAVASLLAAMSRRAPVLLLVDDLHNAGDSTVEWLHYLARRPAGSRLLVLATARVEESTDLRRRLSGRAVEVEVGPLDSSSVHRVAASAGHADAAGEIMRRTNGHPLYVTEVLRALEAGSTTVPDSLQATVLARVRRTGPDCESLLRGAAVLGAGFDPRQLASLLDLREADATARCERALAARLLVVAGRDYVFAHDVVREVLYSSTPTPTLVIHHRRAADLLTDRPEAVARHAAASEDWGRAARALLLAAEAGLGSLAILDAEVLATRALDAAGRAPEPELQARALLLRGRAREAAADYQHAFDDLGTAVTIARAAGDRRLEMQALRELGGDVPAALGVPIADYVRHLDHALDIAESLGDRSKQADLLDRLAVISCNRLRFRQAKSQAERALAAARGCGDDNALLQGLDGLKTVHAYLGEVTTLTKVITELEPLLRRRNDLWRLQWLVFESSFLPLAGCDYAAAAALMEQAVEMSRTSGYVSYQSWYRAHLGWVARLRGDLPAALEQGRRSVDSADDVEHAWLSPAALAMHATTLLEVDRTAEAVALLERAVPVAEQSGAEAYLLRCLAPLAQATGSRDALTRADDLFSGIDCPPRSAWLLGADAYLCLARAWLPVDPGRAADVLEPLLAAARRVPWLPLLAQAEPLAARAATALQ